MTHARGDNVERRVEKERDIELTGAMARPVQGCKDDQRGSADQH